MINRTTQSLLGALGVLALTLGIAEIHPPKGEAAASGSSVATAVSQTTVVCPPPLQGQSGSSLYSLAVPGAVSGGSGAGGSGSGSSGSGGASSAAGAALAPLSAPGSGSASSSPSASSSASSSSSSSPSSSASRSSSASGSASAAPNASASPSAGVTSPPIAQQTQTGGGTTAKAPSGQNAPAMVGTANGALAPGFSVQQNTVASGSLSGISCTHPGTDFWFVGADSNNGSTGYVELSNPQADAADADIQVFGPNGEVTSTAASNISIPGNGSTSLLLSTLVQPGNGGQDLAVHVMVRSGQIAAALHMDTNSGADWVPATTQGSSAYLPGLPGDLHQYNLDVYVPGGQDADLKVQLASQSGLITPAGHETVHIKSGTLSSFSLGDLTRGQGGMLELTPTDPKGDAVPFVAGISTGNSNDTAYLAGVAPITQRGTVAGNASGNTLLLSAPNGAAGVTVTSIGSSGSPATKTVQIPAGSTVSVQLQSPGGSGPFGVTVTPTSGGPVYAAREINDRDGLTIQQIPDDRSTVLVPTVIRNAAILVQ
ncbi:DUF5719 family protein [Streptacidiphilus fuscans]|uniref:Secreted protein n=1 Tax=Streptacidiphilus fuscans TaxID=2789292 RepID=A0A931FIH9_9ACTN|nr:DUF5719 family protein [Streptacidiphilus fuscans]MBF9073325.1 hypothetical protein [Streptacidiphilus fuscans]